MKFGTDGVRGTAGAWPISVHGALRIGRAAAKLCRSVGGTEVLIARDTRPSGEMLAAAVAAGVSSMGCIAKVAGVLPTPGLACGLAAGLAQAGVMITASHNPAPDNGFKVFGPSGRKLTDAQTRQVETWLADDDGVDAVGGEIHFVPVEAMNAYTSALEDALGELQGLPLAVDMANGAATRMLPWLRAFYPGPLTLVGTRGLPNDSVGSEHPEAVQAAVKANGCAAGIAVDGDGDRCVLVDERGNKVDGDGLIWLLARARGVDALAVTVMSNGALAPALPGVTLHWTPVGDRHIKAAMEAHQLELGGEESGHILFGDFPGGDGLLAGLRALGALNGRSVSEVLSGFVPMPRRKSKVRVQQKPALDAVPSIVQAIAAGEAELGEGGRVFLRYSGTEPVLRILVEGQDAQQVDAVEGRVRSVVEQALT